MTPSSKIDLVCVYPNNRARAFGALGEDVAAVTPPLQTALLAAYARGKGFSVKVIDADAEGLTADQTAGRVRALAPLLACISTDYLNSGDVTKMAAAHDTLASLRSLAPGVLTMLEGVVPSAYPDKMLADEKTDFILQGEGFAALTALLAHLKTGKKRPPEPIEGLWYEDGGQIVRSQRPPMLNDLAGLPMAAWDLLPIERYRAHHWHCFDRLDERRPYASIFTNLGCPYSCTFCNVNVVYGKPSFRARSPESVVAELEILHDVYKVRNLRIVDNVFTVRKDLADRLCDLIIKRGLDFNIWVYARVETVDYALLKKMRRAGVRWVAYGIESSVADVRKEVDKASPAAVIERAIEDTRRADINIVGNFIFGLPHDTADSMRKTLQMALDYNFEYANFYSAMAYPGTELHEYARRKGIKLPDSWEGYGQYSENALPMGTETLSPGDVLRFRDEAFLAYSNSPAYQKLLRRKFGQPAVDYLKGILKHKIRRVAA
ncbi:MAG: radical SAM protein [Elusimicrobia bacterium]|nr:radical SAM protein [Elusimicrobiota bacterium]